MSTFFSFVKSEALGLAANLGERCSATDWNSLSIKRPLLKWISEHLQIGMLVSVWNTFSVNNRLIVHRHSVWCTTFRCFSLKMYCIRPGICWASDRIQITYYLAELAPIATGRWRICLAGNHSNESSIWIMSIWTYSNYFRFFKYLMAYFFMKKYDPLF